MASNDDTSTNLDKAVRHARVAADEAKAIAVATRIAADTAREAASMAEAAAINADGVRDVAAANAARAITYEVWIAARVAEAGAAI